MVPKVDGILEDWDAIDMLVILIDGGNMVQVQPYKSGIFPFLKFCHHCCSTFTLKFYPFQASGFYESEGILVNNCPDHRLNHGQVGYIKSRYHNTGLAGFGNCIN
jgi:hypothetical protein